MGKTKDVILATRVTDTRMRIRPAIRYAAVPAPALDEVLYTSSFAKSVETLQTWFARAPGILLSWEAPS